MAALPQGDADSAETLLASVRLIPSRWKADDTNASDPGVITGLVILPISWQQMLSRTFQPWQSLDLVLTELTATSGLGFAYDWSQGVVFHADSSFTMRVGDGAVAQIGPGARPGRVALEPMHSTPCAALRCHPLPATDA